MPNHDSISCLDMIKIYVKDANFKSLQLAYTQNTQSNQRKKLESST